MPAERILILGGTAEAHLAGAALAAEGFGTVTSLAGVTQSPRPVAGGVRRGGFGGAAGLVAYMSREGIAAIVDATHPFAERISRNAASAAHQSRIPYVRFEREPWQAETGDRWTSVTSVAAAAAALPARARVMVTVGRKAIGCFFSRPDLSGVARMIEAPEVAVPAGWCLLLERPPFDMAHEVELMQRHGISHLVTKNSGGEATRGKLIAAREKKIPVVMVSRPMKPEAPSFSSVEALVPALRRLLSA